MSYKDYARAPQPKPVKGTGRYWLDRVTGLDPDDLPDSDLDWDDPHQLQDCKDFVREEGGDFE